jgi:hypothetical protein
MSRILVARGVAAMTVGTFVKSLDKLSLRHDLTEFSDQSDKEYSSGLAADNPHIPPRYRTGSMWSQRPSIHSAGLSAPRRTGAMFTPDVSHYR